MNQKANLGGFGSDFGAFVPGFDFLQKLAQGDHQALLANWIAPTLDPKVLDQRIQELKAVQFWLEQNATALKATLQALEVQKMTLAALQSMGVPGSASTASSPAGAGQSAGAASAAAQPFVADAMQYWSALTQQFQTIAAGAMKDVAARGAAGMPGTTGASASATGSATPAGSGTPRHDAPSAAPAKAPRKTAKKTPGATPDAV